MNERRRRILSEARSLENLQAEIRLLKRKLAEATEGKVDAESVSRIARDIEDKQGALELWKDGIPNDELDEVLAMLNKSLR